MLATDAVAVVAAITVIMTNQNELHSKNDIKISETLSSWTQ